MRAPQPVMIEHFCKHCFAARARLLPLSFCFRVLYRPREHRHRGDRQKARIVLHDYHKDLGLTLVRESSHVRQVQFSPAERSVFRKVVFVLHGTFLSDGRSKFNRWFAIVAASCGYTIHQYPAFIRGPIWFHFQSTHLRHYFSFFVKKHFFYHLFGVYIVVFCLQNGTKMVSFWGQKNSENTLRIQSCYYISLQKSSIVASTFPISKKTAETCSRLGKIQTV